MREIIVAGAGTGTLTPDVQDVLSTADAVCASERFAALVPPVKKFIPLKKFADAFSEIEKEAGRVVILVSGDPGLFSLLPLVKRRFGNVTVLPGISSMQVLCAHAGEAWSDAVILSAHGRPLNCGTFLNTVERSRLVVLFCDGENSPSKVCGALRAVDGVDVLIGERLGCDDEAVFSGKPRDFVKHCAPDLSLMLIRNPSPFVLENIHPRDAEFLRSDGVVMTQEAVRSVILGRLNLKPDAVFWDIGAGTGSISVCVGLECSQSEIHAVECKPEAARLIAQNAAKFRLHNIIIHEGRALEVVGGLPSPSHVFIGGSGGELPGILQHVSQLHARVVVACVTLETLTTAHSIMKTWPDFEALQVAVSASKPLTNASTLMHPHSPVTILSASFAL
ncbi:MAG: precorrin-6y C5,15-methyltransferase (decarboxylating) subunit CbiE [Synergistaceae bacterium]|nr:precorrin-6y C5,15-methyltransferase (decarboxylating) subunit CbiE [Synergistaceae bacterium]